VPFDKEERRRLIFLPVILDDNYFSLAPGEQQNDQLPL
jgi:hypothetical protein